MNGSSQIESGDGVVCHPHSFTPPPPTPLEARLMEAETAREAAEAARDAAEARARRAEADAHRLRQQLALFGEKMLNVAHAPATGSIAAAPTSNDNSHPVVSRPEAPPRNDMAQLPEPQSPDRVDGAAPASSSSTAERASKRTRRVWIFNPKWRVGRDWLEYDAANETMGCSVCRLAGESGKWARTGITRMRLEAITSHANDQKHQRHLQDAENAKRAELSTLHAPQPQPQQPPAVQATGVQPPADPSGGDQLPHPN